jgi:hypothetical protein
MKKPKPYAELVTQAEEATKAIKDPELRRVAFERVLDDLLAGSPGSTPSEARSAKPPRRGRGGSGARPTQKAKKSRGPKGYIRQLFDDGFFKKPKTIAEVKAELANRGHHIALTSLSGPLQSLCQERVLRRHKAKSDKGKKVAYNYSEW